MKILNFGDVVHSLGEMLQFLYRGCIREDKKMNIYIPSSRMRNLLFRWLDGEFDVN